MRSQMCQIAVISQNRVPHAGTLRPRLDSSSSLIDSIAARLQARRRDLQQINDSLMRDGTPDALESGLGDERLVCQAIGALDAIRARMAGITALHSIPSALSPAVTAVRILSSALFELAPACSKLLCTLSVSLGSIVMDSAILTGANCDFGLSNIESNRLLDEAKLMADSKIDKRHPNLDTIRADST